MRKPLLLLLFLLPFLSIAQKISLLKDIYSEDGSGFVPNGVPFNNRFYFVSSTPELGAELFISDGTPEGTHLLKDIVSGSGNSSPDNFTVFSGNVYFTVSNSNSEKELWKTDGTEPGTVKVADLGIGETLVNFGGFTVAATRMFFFKYANNTRTLCSTNGSSVTIIKQVNTANGWEGLSRPVAIGNNLYFSSYDATSGTELWKSDGTPAGTVLLKDLSTGTTVSDGQTLPNSTNPTNLYNSNGRLFFVGDGGSTGSYTIGTSDGTASGTIILKNFNALSGKTYGVSPFGFNYVNGYTLFFADNGSANGLELWRTSGTASGTVLVKDINPGTENGTDQLNSFRFNNKLYFCGITAENGRELWVSDGTSAGTSLFKEIEEGAGNGFSYSNFAATETGFFFSATTAASGKELYFSDGTAAGTKLVKDILPGVVGSMDDSYAAMFALGNKVLFYAKDRKFGSETFVSDGTPEGTKILLNNNKTPQSSNPSMIVTSNGLGYFAAEDGENGTNVWKTDGTEAGTTMIKDLLGPEYFSTVENITVFKGEVYFVSNGLLYKTDGTAEGTIKLSDYLIEQNIPMNGGETKLFPFGDYLYFSARIRTPDNEYGFELCRTDGSANGIVLVKDIAVGGDSRPYDFFAFNNELYFTATTPDAGRELWKTDGTDAGTVMVKDITPGTSDTFGMVGSTKPNFTVVNSTLLFRTGTGLWKTNGTTAGTVLLNAQNIPLAEWFGIVAGNKMLYAAASDGSNDLNLYVSDGTESGTHVVTTYSGLPVQRPYSFNAFKDKVYFKFENGSANSAIWYSDGTQAGTRQFAINAELGNSVTSLYPAGDKLYFLAANNGAQYLYVTDSSFTEAKKISEQNFSQGIKAFSLLGNTFFFKVSNGQSWDGLWFTQGTENSTFFTGDLYPGITSSESDYLAELNGKIIFTATDDTHGRELFVLEPATVLSLVFNSFSVKLESDYAKLTWLTSQEKNVSHFEVQRSSDGKDFRALAAVTRNTSSASGSYSFNDETAYSQLQSVLYYRIKEYDQDGSSNYSKILSVNLPAREIFSAYPNPAAGSVTIAFANSEQKEVVIELIDVVGKRLNTNKLLAVGGTNVYQLDLKNYPPGTYFLRLKGEKMNRIFKIVHVQ